MRQSNTVCLACRFQLLAVKYGTRPRPSWQASRRLNSSSATAVPLRSAQSHDRTEHKVAFEQQFSKKILPKQDWDGREPNRPTSKNHPQAGGPRKQTPPNQKWNGRGQKERGVREGTGALDIFKNVVEGNAHDREAPAASSAATLQLYKDVATLEDMMARDTNTTAECFQFFKTHVYDPISRGDFPVPKVLRNRVGRALMERVARARKEDFDSRELPSVTSIGQILQQLELFNLETYGALMTDLLAHICSINTEPREYTSIESYETAMARRDTMLHDLVGAWKVVNVMPPLAGRSGSSAAKVATQAARLPQLPEKLMSGRLYGKARDKLSLASMLPRYPPPSLRASILTAAIATYVLLTDPISRANRILRAEIAPFVDSLAAVFLRQRPDKRSLPKLFGQRPVLRNYVTERWMAVEAQLEEQSKFHDVSVSVGVGGPDGDHQRNTANEMQDIHRKLGQAYNTSNARMLGRTWDEFWALVNASPERKKDVANAHAGLFNYFIKAYMGIRQADRAIEIWNCMLSVGLQPTVKTWTSMLDGYKGAKNLTGLKKAWDKVIASGMKLDMAIWTTRISGLVELADAKAGLAALEEMAALWKQSQLNPNKPIPAAVKPTIGPVNAALAGLLRLDQANAANGLLSWAAKQGIQPDIYTFNTLLGPLVRKGLDEEVSSIFALMKSQHVEADTATFAILLEGTLDDIGSQPPQQQIQTIKNFLRAMRSAGLTANMQLFAKMIHLLLQEGDRTSDAVNEVLAIIWGQELELTSHIYTMLADHYFTSSPTPKPWAVTALIENRKLHENRDIDRVFWERVISGYCQVGDITRALQIFDRIDRSGGKITFSTLYDLLLVLSRAGDNEAIGRLIEVARKNIDHGGDQGTGTGTGTAGGGGGGTGTGDKGSRFWKHRFWHLADKYGFLGEDLKQQFRMGNLSQHGG